MSKRICFLVRHLNDGRSGGAELQVHLYSRVLAQRGWNVWVIGEGVQPLKGESTQGGRVQYVFLPSRKRGLGLLNYRHLKLALERIRPHVCYQRVKLDYTYWMVRLARYIGSKSLFAFSSDHECLPGALVGMQGDLVSRYMAALADQGVRKADLLLCQTEKQSKLIKANFAREAVVIKNGHPLPGVKEISYRRPEVLWVNHFKPVKQPEVFLRLASELREEDAVFTMIGARGNYSLDEGVTEGEQSANLNFLGEQSLAQVNERLWACRLVVNTSQTEGFPNTFIQAWARFVPVVSLRVDPDEVIAKHQLGFCSGDFSRMISHTRTLIREPDVAAKMGRNGRAYVEQEHDLAENARRLDQLLQRLTS